ncbi:hypothetical protein MOSL_1451 [Moraxella osloensis]|nr:hypothetical protein MOSL_1451 [Moraxella osloensis]
MLVKKDTHKTNLLKMPSKLKTPKLKISKLKMPSNYSIYQKFNEKFAEFQKTI